MAVGPSARGGAEEGRAGVGDQRAEVGHRAHAHEDEDGEEAGVHAEVEGVIEEAARLDHVAHRVQEGRGGDARVGDVGQQAAETDGQEQQGLELLDDGQVDQHQADDDHDQLAEAERQDRGGVRAGQRLGRGRRGCRILEGEAHDAGGAPHAGDAAGGEVPVAHLVGVDHAGDLRQVDLLAHEVGEAELVLPALLRILVVVVGLVDVFGDGGEILLGLGDAPLDGGLLVLQGAGGLPVLGRGDGLVEVLDAKRVGRVAGLELGEPLGGGHVPLGDMDVGAMEALVGIVALVLDGRVVLLEQLLAELDELDGGLDAGEFVAGVGEGLGGLGGRLREGAGTHEEGKPQSDMLHHGEVSWDPLTSWRGCRRCSPCRRWRR